MTLPDPYAPGLRSQPSHRTTPAPVPPDAAWRRLREAAAEPHRTAGRFAWHFARGKLGHDPVFRHLLEAGLIGPQARVVDLGCGQALLPHLLLACRALAAAGQWPASWPAAPGLAAYRGVELMPKDVARAQAALRARQAAGSADATEATRLPLAVTCVDMCDAPLPVCDTVVILDVLHYVPIAAQDALLARVRAALVPGGALLLRIGDMRQRRGFRISQWVDRLVTRVRGHRVPPTWCRALPEWQATLAALGFTVEARPMSHGTPFANVLLVARRGLTP